MDDEATGMLDRMDPELSRLPESEKKGLSQARAMNPATIADESNPALFHRHCHDDTAKAASMLASFWEARLALFGEKAFSPLFDATSGRFGRAVSQDDLKTLESGHVQLLSSDSTQQRFLFLNPSSPVPHSLEALKRVVFLAAQSLVCDANQTSEQGITIILLVDQDLHAQTIDLLRWTCNIVAVSMPLTLARLHFVKTSTSPLPSEALALVDSLMQEGLVDEVVFTASRDDTQLVQKLQKYGLGRSALPNSLGGNFKWMSSRLLDMAFPKKMKAIKTPMLGYSESSGGVATETTTGVEESSESSKPEARLPNLDCNEEESSNQRPRTRNAIYSRRKYLRKKIEFEVLEREVNRLQTDNSQLKQEEKRLEDLLQLAVLQVQRHGILLSNPSAGLDTTFLGASGPKIYTNVLRQAHQATIGRDQSQPLNNPALLLAQRQSNIQPHSAPYLAGPQPVHLDQAGLSYMPAFLAFPGQDLTLPQFPGGHPQALLANSISQSMIVPPQLSANTVGQSSAADIVGRLGREPTQEEIRRLLQERLLNNQGTRRY